MCVYFVNIIYDQKAEISCYFLTEEYSYAHAWTVVTHSYTYLSVLIYFSYCFNFIIIF